MKRFCVTLTIGLFISRPPRGCYSCNTIISMKEVSHFKELLIKYIDDTITDEEFDEFLQKLEEEKNSRDWLDAFSQVAKEFPPDEKYDPARWEDVVSKILMKKNLARSAKPSFKWLYRVAAAILFFIIGFGAWYGFRHAEDKLSGANVASAITRSSGDILPGGNKAVLTLSNGSRIILDSLHTDTVALHKSVGMVQLNPGVINYRSDRNKRASVVYNTLSTPRGGQYQLVLPDGSKVWLNSASSIHFPVSFSGSTREVSITGEAYFEIARNENKPFIVKVGDMAINVLGTRFNVMAYSDEAFSKTTLLEGAVKIVTHNEARMLSPGEQINLNKAGEIKWIKQVDVDETIAWKNGLFDFSDADIPSIMRILSRWYNIEVEYKNGVPPGQITGKIPRDTRLSNVLKMLELSGVHYEMTGQKIIILNQ